MLALHALKKQVHPLFCACREKHRVGGATVWAAHFLGAGEGGVGRDVREDDCLVLAGVDDLVAVDTPL